MPPPSRGLRHVGLVANLCRRPATGLRAGSRQLSSKPAVNLLLTSRGPRNTFILSQTSWKGASAKATFLGLSWSKSSKAAEVDTASPATIEQVAPSTAPASSAESTPPLPAESSIPPPPEATTPLFDQLPDTFLTGIPDITEIPNHVGFLKEMGLDYGWGPTSFLEFLIENIHIYVGTPWWGTIILTATAVRVLLLYFHFRSTNEMAKMSGMKPVMDKLQAKAKKARAEQDGLAMMAIQEEMMQAKKIAGLKMYWMFTPMVMQGVLGWCSFRLLRAMANLPVPGLEEGGFWWITDLTVSDPYYVLPVAMGGLIHMLTRSGGESGAHQVTTAMRPVLLYVMPVVFSGVMLVMPAILQVSFFAATLLGMIQAFVFKNPRFRQAVGLLPIVKPNGPTTLDPLTRTLAPASKASLTKQKLRVVPAYQPPSVSGIVNGVNSSKTVDGKPKKGMFEGVKDDFKTAQKEIMNKVGMGDKTEKKGARSDSFVKSANAYEKKRKAEKQHDKDIRKRMRE